MLTVGLALLAVRPEDEQAGQILGTALTVRIAAYVVVSPIASALVAGRSSRGILIAADAARVVVAAGLVFATEAWHVYLAIMLLQSASAGFALSAIAVLLIALAVADPADPSAPLAVALVLFGAGSIVVGVPRPSILDRVADRTVMAAGASLATLVLGAASSAISRPRGRIIRRDVAAEDRPAVLAARFSSSHAWYAVAYPVAGLLGAAAGPGIATAALAVFALLAPGAAAALSTAGRDQVGRD